MLVIINTPNIFLTTSAHVCAPPHLSKIFATLKWVCWKIGNNFFFRWLIPYLLGQGYGIISYSSLSTRYVWNIYEKKICTHEISTRKNFGPTKISTRKTFEPQNTHEKKFWTHENIHEKKCWPPKYPQEKTLDLRNTHEKNFGPTKYPREKFLDLRNTHEKKFLDPRRHNGTRPPEFITLLIYIGLSRENVKSLVNKTKQNNK